MILSPAARRILRTSRCSSSLASLHFAASLRAAPTAECAARAAARAASLRSAAVFAAADARPATRARSVYDSGGGMGAMIAGMLASGLGDLQRRRGWRHDAGLMHCAGHGVDRVNVPGAAPGEHPAVAAGQRNRVADVGDA